MTIKDGGLNFAPLKLDEQDVFAHITALCYYDNTLYVGTEDNGLWMSIETLTQLERVQLANTPSSGTNAYITSITMALIPSIFKYAPIPLVATANQGLFAPSGIDVLSRIGTGIGAGWQINVVYTVPIGSSGNIIFVGTEGHGLLISKDEGVTFTQVAGIGDNFSIKSLSSSHDGCVLVGTENNGLWKASDVYATTLTQVAGGLGNNWDIISTSNTDVGLFVGTLNNGLLISEKV